MTLTLDTNPPYPILKTGARLFFRPTAGGDGNYVRVWCTAAPLGSQLREQIGDASANRAEIFASDIAAAPPGGGQGNAAPFHFQPEKPGRYTLLAQEYQKGASSFGGGYAGDPLGFGKERKVGGEVSFSVAFGSRYSMQLGVSPDTATLVLYVWDDSVRETTFALHGESSPALINPATDVAKTAVLTLSTAGVMNAFVGQAATTIVGDTNAIVFDLMNKFGGHFPNIAGSPAVHAHQDSYNTPNIALIIPTSKKMLLQSVQEIITVLTQHMNTDQARRSPFVSAGIGTGNWHEHSSSVIADGSSSLIAPPPATVEQAYIGLSDCWRAYEHHRNNLDVHGSADTDYPLAAPPILMMLHINFLTLIQSASPSPTETENAGGPILVGGAGMKEG